MERYSLGGNTILTCSGRFGPLVARKSVAVGKQIVEKARDDLALKDESGAWDWNNGAYWKCWELFDLRERHEARYERLVAQSCHHVCPMRHSRLSVATIFSIKLVTASASRSGSSRQTAPARGKTARIGGGMSAQMAGAATPDRSKQLQPRFSGSSRISRACSGWMAMPSRRSRNSGMDFGSRSPRLAPCSVVRQTLRDRLLSKSAGMTATRLAFQIRAAATRSSGPPSPTSRDGATAPKLLNAPPEARRRPTRTVNPVSWTAATSPSPDADPHCRGLKDEICGRFISNGIHRQPAA